MKHNRLAVVFTATTVFVTSIVGSFTLEPNGVKLHVAGAFAQNCPQDPDHPDDFQSFSTWKSGSEYQAKYVTAKPEVALLKSGFWSMMEDLLGYNKISVLFVEKNFNPDKLLEHVNVLVVPTGGFTNQSNNEALRVALERFVSLGGTLVVMTQPTAADWRLLPGGEVKASDRPGTASPARAHRACRF